MFDNSPGSSMNITDVECCIASDEMNLVMDKYVNIVLADVHLLSAGENLQNPKTIHRFVFFDEKDTNISADVMSEYVNYRRKLIEGSNNENQFKGAHFPSPLRIKFKL